MAININAKTSGAGGLETTADNTGNINIQSGGSTVMSVTSSGVAITGALSQNGAVYSTQPSFRNLIINGDMRIDQRATSVTSSAYTVDRWGYYGNLGSKATVAQSSIAPTGYTNSLLATSSSAYSVAATDIFVLRQYIEGNNIAHLGWGTANAKTVTLSFWVRSSLTGTFGGVLKNAAEDRCYPYSYTISSANTWEQKSITIAGDTTGTWGTGNGSGIQLTFGLGVGTTYSGTAGAWSGTNYLASATGATSVVGTSGATFYITGVQLEVGSTATDFENLPYDVQLARCQRYYYKLAEGNTVFMTNGCAFNATTVTTGINFPTEMRSTPTLDATSGTDYYRMRATGTNFTGSGLSLMGNTLNGKSACFQYTTSGMSSGIGGLVITNNSNAYVAFTAEL